MTSTDAPGDDTAPDAASSSAAAPAAPPAAPGPPPPTGAPRDSVPPAAAFPPAPRKRRRLGFILGLSLGGFGVLLIAAVSIVVGVLSAQHAPSASVDRFLNALEKGHARAAVAQLSPAPIASTTLMKDSVYEHVTNRVTRHQILSTTTHGSRSVVTVRLTTKSGSFRQAFTLVTHRKAFLWDVWTVDGSSFPVIQLVAELPKGLGVTMDDVEIQKEESDFDAYLALPGDYTFALDGDTSLVTTSARSVTVRSFTGNHSVTLQPRLTDDGVAAARAVVDAFLDSCVAQPVLAPTGNCGFAIINDEPGVTVDNIQWSIKQRPVVEFGAWNDGVWDVKTDTAGSFEMNAEGHLGSAHGEVDGLIDDYDVQGFVAMVDADHLIFHSGYKGDDANTTPNA
jgi:hypothetical protein